MHKRITSSAALAILTAGFVGASVAGAWADPQTDGSGGVASGNQVNVPVDVEADLCGNSLAVLGISQAQCTKVSEVLYSASDQGGGAPQTDGSGGVASGNQINIPVDVALDICGNSAAVGGVSTADCEEVVTTLAEESDGGGAPQTDGSGGVASGNQINIPIDAAIDICGNSVAVLGASSAQCNTVINVIKADDGNEGSGGKDSSEEGSSAQTDGSGGVASGNQVNVPVDAATSICGNAVSVLGVSEASCMTKISEDGDSGGQEPGDGGKDEPAPEEPGDGEKGEEPVEDPSPSAPAKESGESADPQKNVSAVGALPTTGAALGGLIAAGVAAIGGGAGAMVLARKRRSAAAGAAGDSAGQD
ncbi:chaplin family protein [Nocardiopsis coralliicola]